MTRTRSSRALAKSRRRFLKVASLGAAAALASAALPVIAGPADAATAARGAARPKPAPTRPPALEAEIAKQKKSTADVVKAIRDYELPAGSEQAFVFAPERAAKRRAGQRPAAAASTTRGSR